MTVRDEIAAAMMRRFPMLDPLKALELADTALTALKEDSTTQKTVVGEWLRQRDTLRTAWSCLLEVRRDFDAPINNVIAEVEQALGLERGQPA